MFSNSNSNIATTVATAAAAAANTRSSSVASRSSPYNYATAAAGAAAYGTNVNMHHHQNPQYQDYSMYPTMDPMAWHATYAAAAYRGYEAATAVSDIWPPQSYPHAAAHMNMLPNNDLSEASSSLNLAAAESNFLASASNGGLASSTASASNQRSNSPSEYKVFNNNESRENEVKPLTVRPSPDSGLAASEAMSNSGSPNANGGHNLVSQGSPIPGSNLVVRPSAARSPYEWMRKPSNGLQARPKEGERSRTRTKDKYRVVYSDHQRLELEKEFHYSRYITIRRKAELAQALNLSERQVKIWFQNRRAKERKQMKKRDELIHKEKLEVAATLQAAASAASNVHHPFTFPHPAVMSAHLP